MRNMTQLTSVMPADVAKLIGDQLMNVVKTSDGKKGFGLLLALALALFGARNGAGAVITALNIAYEEQEKRGFVHVNLLAIGITATAVLVAIVAIVAITAMGLSRDADAGAPGRRHPGREARRLCVLTLAGAGAAATLYRYGPSRRRARMGVADPGIVVRRADVAGADDRVRHLRREFRQLQRDLWVAGRGRGDDDVAVPVELYPDLRRGAEFGTGAACR